MGTHISRVKSVDLDAWTDEQLQSMLRWGNARANKSVYAFVLALEDAILTGHALQILGGQVAARARAGRKVRVHILLT